MNDYPDSSPLFGRDPIPVLGSQIKFESSGGEVVGIIDAVWLKIAEGGKFQGYKILIIRKIDCIAAALGFESPPR